jgi:hypothetical protein
MQKFVYNETSAKMERNEQPSKVSATDSQIAELVGFIDTLRLNKTSTISYRDMFFKRLKTYI